MALDNGDCSMCSRSGEVKFFGHSQKTAQVT